MNSNLPPLAVVLLAYQRTDYAIETLKTAAHYLDMHPSDVIWYIADDGSDEAHYEKVLATAREHCNGIVMGHSLKRGYAGNANAAVEALKELTPITLWLEDDWRMEWFADTETYMRILLEHEDVGMIRLAHLPANLHAHTVGYKGRMFLDIQKTCQYHYSGNPHLKHSRFFVDYGLWPQDKNPGQTEVHYDYLIRNTKGSKILWPVAIGDEPVFAHIGEVRSYDPS